MKAAQRVTAIAALLLIGLSCSSSRDWDKLGLPGMFSATLKTDWRDAELLYQIDIRVDSAYWGDSIPSQALVRFYDRDGFEVMSWRLPVSSAGARGEVSANNRLACPVEQETGVICTKSAYNRASRWTVLPSTRILDPM